MWIKIKDFPNFPHDSDLNNLKIYKSYTKWDYSLQENPFLYIQYPQIIHLKNINEHIIKFRDIKGETATWSLYDYEDRIEKWTKLIKITDHIIVGNLFVPAFYWKK